jgi:hypothetical protein
MIRYQYRVIVKDQNRKVVLIKFYDDLPDAKLCFEKFLKTHSHQKKIILESTNRNYEN